jgi:hypothetical protein
MYDSSDPFSPSCDERGAKAQRVLADYEPNADPDTAATDLMADIMHLLGEDVFDQCAASALMHYTEEREAEALYS